MQRALLATVVLFLAASARGAEPAVELFRDDFSRYPPGPLTRPIGQLNGAIQEYHYLANRGVPLEPWANAICHLDAWAAGKEDGKPFVEQQLPATRSGMAPRLFSPLFVTGEPEWGDYTVEALVRPLSSQDMAGIVFRYHTNRHHYLFCLQDGKHARLALRLPLDQKLRIADWKELGTADFPYDQGRSYRLTVENQGANIRALIDGKLVLTARSDELPIGKVGLAAHGPARFQDFRVTVLPETQRAIAERIQQRNAELARLQASNPRPKLWKKFDTPTFGAGRNVRFGDLDGDGVLDMLIAQNTPKTPDDRAVEISCLTAVTLDGKVLWQVGEPHAGHGLLTCDTPFQIHDFEGQGRCDVVVARDRRLQILDGRTGKVKKSAPLPRVKDYPKVPQMPAKDWPTDVSSGDAIAILNFSGKEHAGEILLKDRYWNFWIFDSDLKLLWTGQGLLGHYPYAVPSEGGRDRLAIGYSLWDGSGKQLWSLDQELKDHADSVVVGNFSGDPKEPPRAYYCGSDEGFVLVDHRGVIQRHVRIGHAQTAAIGKFRPELPGLQYVTINFWKNPGIVSLFQHDGQLLQQEEPIHSGSPLLPVNWRGDGQEFVLLSGNVREGGMLDGRLRRAVRFPDDGHPDLCAAVLDLTGDARDEIVLWDQDRVWIYTQDRPFDGKKIYAPVRNPLYNDSNYRCSVSLPSWKEVREPAGAKTAAPYPPSRAISSIDWAPAATILRKAKGSDNWPLTWADDDHLYTAYGDGWGFEPLLPVKLSLGFARVEGGPTNPVGVNVRSPSLEDKGDGKIGKKASGLLMVDGVLYLWVRNTSNAQLAWSSDHGKTWTWSDWKFTTSFGCPTFLNFGQNYAGARDEYVYVYAHDSDTAYQTADRMVLARVPKDRIKDRAAYEFLQSLDPQTKPHWTKDLNERGAVFTHPGNCYRSGITYNAGLKRYLWCQTLPGKDARFGGGFGVYDAPEPWGPWTTVYFTENWDVGPGETSSFPPKWMSPDGRTLYFVFSGNDSFSVRRARLTTAGAGG